LVGLLLIYFLQLRSGKRLRSEEELERADHEFHQSFKPNWSANGTLVYATSGSIPALDDGILVNFKSPLVAEHQDVHFASFTTPEVNIPETIPLQFETCDLFFHNDQIPTTITVDAFDFSNYAEAITPNTPARIHEQHVWSLTSILFDDSRNESQTGSPEGKLRKQKLIDFWCTLTRKDAETQLQRAQTPEEKAFIYLTCGDVVDACTALIESNNIHLATIVAQLPGDSIFRQTMAKQLDAWREINVLSEIKDPIRAIYEMLAGHVSGSEGKMTGTAPENRITPLRFTERFGLTWRQAFGLRLLYGIDEADDIMAAVSQYAEDLAEHRESVLPIPWFVEQGVDMDWIDPQLQQREDVLWGLLKLYGRTGFEDEMGDVRLAQILTPENVSGNPIDARLSFQLFHLLRAKRVGITDEAENTTAADSLSRTYAAALEQIASKDLDALKTTIWVLTHLSTPEERETTIKRILNLHATMLNPTDHSLTISIPNETSPRVLVPREWECAAKALHARAVEHDHIAEARWLINAGELREAHDVMRRIIGPQAVIEGSFDQLREVLGSLVDDGHRKTQVSKQAWERGGGLYHVYIELLDLESMHDSHRVKSKLNVKSLVRGLAKTLEGIWKEDGLKGREIRERIALQIMAGKVAEITEREKVRLKNSAVEPVFADL
jgi:nuclear pore complex protein Nup98-Nup96